MEIFKIKNYKNTYVSANTERVLKLIRECNNKYSVTMRELAK